MCEWSCYIICAVSIRPKLYAAFLTTSYTGDDCYNHIICLTDNVARTGCYSENVLDTTTMKQYPDELCARSFGLCDFLFPLLSTFTGTRFRRLSSGRLVHVEPKRGGRHETRTEGRSFERHTLPFSH